MHQQLNVASFIVVIMVLFSSSALAFRNSFAASASWFGRARTPGRSCGVSFMNSATTKAAITTEKEEKQHWQNNQDEDSYWMQQIRKQGKERQDLQWFKSKTSLPFDCTACGKC